MQQAFRALGCEVEALEEKQGGRAEAALEALHAERPIELVYERYALGASAAGRFSRRFGVPHVLEVNSPLVEEAARHRGARIDDETREREAAVLAGSDHVFAVSAAVAEHVAELGVARDRIHVHPNAVDAERFRPHLSDEVRGELGLPTTAFLLGFHGRLRPWHGFERVAEAARRLIDRGCDVHVLTVGEGDFAGELARAGLERRSTCVPWVAHDQVARFVACFDALPLAYGADAPFYFSPLKLLEAMACAAVPVVPALGELPELVEQGAAGLVYPAGSTPGLVEALDRLIHDVDLRARLGARAVELARGRSWTAIARVALDLAREEQAA
jgi:glycosyltransferase involved in cell wall biosynthesis